jgi:hypothetical protein
MGAQVREEVAERQTSDHRRERLVVAETMGAEPPQTQHHAQSDRHRQGHGNAAAGHAAAAVG